MNELKRFNDVIILTITLFGMIRNHPTTYADSKWRTPSLNMAYVLLISGIEEWKSSLPKLETAISFTLHPRPPYNHSIERTIPTANSIRNVVMQSF